MRPGFFFFLPSPKVLCPEVLAVAMPSSSRWDWVGLTSVYSVSPLPRKSTVPTLVSAAAAGSVWFFWRVGGCLWRCPRAPWDMRGVRWWWWWWWWQWGPWLWLGSRHSLDLQWLCQSLPPSAWARPLFLSPSASPRVAGDNKGYLWVCTHTLMQSSPLHCEAIVGSASYIFLMDRV